MKHTKEVTDNDGKVLAVCDRCPQSPESSEMVSKLVRISHGLVWMNTILMRNTGTPKGARGPANQ